MKPSSLFTSSFSLIRPFLVYAVYLAVLLVSLDQFFVSLIIPMNPTTNYGKIYRFANEEHDDEIPLLGSSTVVRGLLPEELGPQFFNYGITATNFQKMEPLLRMELAKDKSTPIIIEMPPPFFQEHPRPKIRMEDYLPFLHQDTFGQFMKNYDFYKPWHAVPGMRFYGYYTRYLSAAANQQLPPDMFYTRGAKYIKKKTGMKKKADFIEFRRKNPVIYVCSPKLLERFKQLLAQTNRPIVMVVSPFHPVTYEVGFDLENYVRLFEQLESEFPHVKGFIADGRNYDDELFLDTSHLNYWGALKFTEELRSALVNFGIIAR